MYVPELLDGDGIVERDTGQRVDADRLRQAFEEMKGSIPVIQAVEEKRVTLTLQEYLMQPAAFVTARNIYAGTISELRAQK